MGNVYGRLSFMKSASHTSCNPSKAKAQSELRASYRAASLDQVEDDASSSGSQVTAPVTRQVSRRRSINRPATLRRSARLSGVTGSTITGGPAGLRRSARLAHLATPNNRSTCSGGSRAVRSDGATGSAHLGVVANAFRSERPRRRLIGNNSAAVPVNRPITRSFQQSLRRRS